ncbi:2-nitropropane dioxygenase [Parasitella parasitica]|nr:2-nitropropane dioxygenase [Parasitella parasitica]
MATTHGASWAATAITKALHIQYPIIQAPCAGHTGADLIAAVSNAGGLGSLGAGMLPAPQLRTTIHSIREKTSRPFAVNLFCRAATPPTSAELQKHYTGTDDVLNEIRTELHIPIPSEFQPRSPPFEDQVNVILEERVPVVSFTFGLLPDKFLQRLQSAGTFLIGTATTVQEALVLAGLDPSDPTRKADAIVAQGLEAGGHRGSFLKICNEDKNHRQLPVSDLVEAIRSTQDNGRFPIPIIAAGGISSGSDVYRALHDWKADGAAIGTLFMMAKESTTPKGHRDYMLNAKKNGVEKTRITTAITGRSVRSYPNKLMKRIEEASSKNRVEIPNYDIQSAKTKDIAAYATQNGIQDYMMLLSGANAPLAVDYSEQCSLSATEIVNKLVTDVDKMMAAK